MKKKQEIIAFLEGHAYQDGYLAWDVKVRNPNLDFEHLLELYRDSGRYASDEKYLDDAEWRRGAQKLHDPERLCDIAYEDAQAYVLEETQWNLPSGRSVTACFGFEGRSNGWIVLRSFELLLAVRTLKHVFRLAWVARRASPASRAAHGGTRGDKRRRYAG